MSNQTLKVDLGASRVAGYLHAGLVVAVLFAVGSAALSWYLRIVLIVVLFAFVAAVATGRRTMDRFRCRDDGLLDVWTGEDWESASLCSDTLVRPVLTVLRFRRLGAGRCETRILFRDSVDVDTYRKLSIWLKWKGRCDGKRPDGPEMILRGRRG